METGGGFASRRCSITAVTAVPSKASPTRPVPDQKIAVKNFKRFKLIGPGTSSKKKLLAPA
jgi:hypothetical protein